MFGKRLNYIVILVGLWNFAAASVLEAQSNLFAQSALFIPHDGAASRVPPNAIGKSVKRTRTAGNNQIHVQRFDRRFATAERNDVVVSVRPIAEDADQLGSDGAQAGSQIVYSNTNWFGFLVIEPFKIVSDDIATVAECGCYLESIEIGMSTGGDDVDVLIGLYDTCPGDGGHLVSGTQGAASNIQSDSVVIIRAEYPDRPFIRNEAWLGVETSGDAFWLGGAAASVGFTDDLYNPDGAKPVCDATIPPSYAGFYARITCGPTIDCNDNGKPDHCDVESGQADDCNGNFLIDDCEVAAGTTEDCNANGRPDECDVADVDCNESGLPDECDVVFGNSADCDGNLVPDECEPDCNLNNWPDACDIIDGTSTDCNANQIPDTCDLISGESEDCDGNQVPDECDPDCNDNGRPDDCDRSIPGIVAHDEFLTGVLDPAIWESAEGVDVFEGFVRIGAAGEYMQSVPFNLSGASRVALALHWEAYAGFTGVTIEYGVEGDWRFLQELRPFNELSDSFLWEKTVTVDLPRDAMTPATRIRFVGLLDLGIMELYTFSLIRLEEDCDENGVNDTCQDVPVESDCNGNGLFDTCERTTFKLGFGEFYDVGPSPNDVKVADVNRDGRPDILVGQGTFTGDGFLKVLLNDGTGRFELRESLQLADNPRSIAVIDTNMDQYPDVVAASLYGHRVHYIQNLGGNWWGFPQSQDIAFGEAQSVDVADFNSDGFTDVVATTGDIFQGKSSEVTILLGNDAGAFESSFTYPTETQGRDVEVMDLNNDGRPDFAVAAQISDRVQFFLNLGQDGDEWAGLASAASVPVLDGGVCPFHLDSADFNKDGWQDIAVGVGNGIGMVEIMLNGGVNADATWRGIDETRAWFADGEVLALHVHDMDGDGWMDVVAGVDEGRIDVLRNLGNHESGIWLGLRRMATIESRFRPHGIDVADLNADGLPDIVVANRATHDGGGPVGLPGVHVIYSVAPWSDDCNANAINDECDIASGTSSDVDGDGVPDECRPDCNGNQLPDDFEIREHLADDCNDNGTIDDCEIADADAEDCNENGVPDDCELAREHVIHARSELPLCCQEQGMFVVDLSHAPPATGFVRIDMEFGTNAHLDVVLGETVIADNLGGTFQCYPPETETLYVSANDFNATLAGEFPQLVFYSTGSPVCERVTIGINPLRSADKSYPFANAKITYLIPSVSVDCNDNGRPDACDLADGTMEDCDADGIGDYCQNFARPRVFRAVEGLAHPINIVRSTAPYPDGYLVSDLIDNMVMHLTSDGQISVFSDDIFRPVDIHLIPAVFTGTEDQYYVNSQTGRTIDRLHPDGSRTLALDLQSQLDVLNGFVHVPVTHPSQAANKIIVTTGGSVGGGEIFAVDASGDSELLAEWPSALWTPSLAPADFGAFSRTVLVGEAIGNGVMSFNLETAQFTPFAELPLVEPGGGIRMISFSPVGWGAWLSRGVEDERVAMISVGGDFLAESLGVVHFVDQRGKLLGSFIGDQLDRPIDPRGMLFEDDRVLICDARSGSVLSLTSVSLDCDDDDSPDSCAIAQNADLDLNVNGVIDDCEWPGDADGDTLTTLRDWRTLQSCFGESLSPPTPCTIMDVDNNGVVDSLDHAQFDFQWP